MNEYTVLVSVEHRVTVVASDGLAAMEAAVKEVGPAPGAVAVEAKIEGTRRECGARDPDGYICTLAFLHEGDHEAWSVTGRVATW